MRAARRAGPGRLGEPAGDVDGAENAPRHKVVVQRPAVHLLLLLLLLVGGIPAGSGPPGRAGGGWALAGAEGAAAVVHVELGDDGDGLDEVRCCAENGEVVQLRGGADQVGLVFGGGWILLCFKISACGLKMNCDCRTCMIPEKICWD
jgi:hypothetical protein